MANFDIAVGISQNAMNEIASVFYNKGKTSIFRGSIDIGAGLMVAWQVNTPPVINLAPPALNKAQRIVERCDLTKYPLLLSAITPEAKNKVAQFMTDSNNGFSLTIDELQLIFESGPVTVPLYARGSITTSGSQVHLNLLSVAIKVEGSVNQNIVNKFIIPKLMTVLGGAFSSVSIPPLSLPNISLGGSRAAIQNRQVIVFSNISSNPLVPSIDGFGFPSAPFFAVLSQNALQQEVNNSIVGKIFGPSGSVDLDITTAYYNATVAIQRAQVSIAGTNLNVKMVLSGSAGASMTIGCTQPGLDFNVYVMPDPTVTCNTSIRNNNILVNGSTCTAFATIVTGGSSIVPVASALVDIITSAIASSVTTTLSGQIVGILSLGSFQLPQISVNYGDVRLNMSGTNMAMAHVSDCLAIQGAISVF